MSSSMRRAQNSRLSVGEVQQQQPQYTVMEIPNDGRGLQPTEQDVAQALQRNQPMQPPPGYQYQYEPVSDNNSNAMAMISKLSLVFEDALKGIQNDMGALQQRLDTVEKQLGDVQNSFQWASGEIQKLNGIIAQQRSQPVVPPMEFTRYQRMVPTVNNK